MSANKTTLHPIHIYKNKPLKVKVQCLKGSLDSQRSASYKGPQI